MAGKTYLHKMEVPALLSKLDELNHEGQQVQKEINSVDEQLAKTDLDLTMISQVCDTKFAYR